MSFRLPRGPRLITIFHDHRSPVSQRVLRLLEAKARPASLTLKEDRQVGEGQRSPARQYLDEASSAIQLDPPFELEIVERTNATPDQWRVIGSYLNRTRQSQLQELKEDEGPFVVDWDDGKVIRSEGDAEQLVSRLSDANGRPGSQGQDSGSWCAIA